ncbi:hypothetical protein Ddye_027109 [Dipteronia dyeriana]|uniref:Uncharacterized protein n=1 Tax=Dipteronia dyeriana TaxID=168575 RepID=A0AAD9WPV7_9ROSI|nr:hypothetical protein Ddye_027109 [Dipteronia dyeriana]
MQIVQRKIESRRHPSWKKNVIIIVASIISVMAALVLVWFKYARMIKCRNEGNTIDNCEMDENGEAPSYEILLLLHRILHNFSQFQTHKYRNTLIWACL